MTDAIVPSIALAALLGTCVALFILTAQMVEVAVHDTVGDGAELAKVSEIVWINPLNLLPLLVLMILAMRKAQASLAPCRRGGARWPTALPVDSGIADIDVRTAPAEKIGDDS